MDNEDDKPRKLMLFNRDITAIPCLRNSLLYGLGSGVVFGLGGFLLTSRGKLATDVGMVTFMAVTMSYWFKCRYDYVKLQSQTNQWQAIMQEAMVLEGTNKGMEFGKPDKALTDV